MDQIKQMLAGMTLRQKLAIAGAALLVLASIAFGVRWNRERDLRPLFTNLAAEDAGAVVEKLKAAGVEYKIADGGVVMVPSSRVAELRIDMASAGLPRSSRVGFELFDKVNLGATEFAEHVNFRRAIEGELERSVMALNEVERARVHVTFAKDSLYTDTREPAKASVMVRLKPLMVLSQANVLAIQHLSASAVEGLSPDKVSVLDMQGNLLSRARPQLDPAGANSSAMLDYRQGLERDYLAKIRSTLDPLLGPEKYRAGVSLECDFTSGEQSEEVFDPNKSVMVTSQRTEDASSTVSAGGGQPGAASSLPRPAPRAGGGSGGVSRKTESTTYQTSRVVKHTKLPQGGVKRLSVSVLVDQRVRWEGVGPKARRILEPPPPEKLKVVRDVLAGVVGFQQDRGDQILVETLPFEATLFSEPPPAPPAKAAPPAAFQPPAWMAPLLKHAPLPVWIGAAAALAIVFLMGIFLIVRKLFKKKKPAAAGASVEGGLHAVDGAPASAGQIGAGPQGPGFEEKAMAVLENNRAEQEKLERETILSLQLPPQTKKSEVLKKVISEQTKKDAEATAQLIRTWMTEQR